jgi:hypothetical protein
MDLIDDDLSITLNISSFDFITLITHTSSSTGNFCAQLYISNEPIFHISIRFFPREISQIRKQNRNGSFSESRL